MIKKLKEIKKKINWAKTSFWFVFATLVISTVFSLVNFIMAPTVPTLGLEHQKPRSEYALMLVQCILGMVVMFLPSMLEKRWRIEIPGFMHIMFVFFLYAAIYLGEVRSFYYKIPHWDTVLHTFSGAMIGALGFSIVKLLNDSEKVQIYLSPLFLSVFAFSFALAVGALWEIYEYSFDGLLGLNMQKFARADGTLLVGRAALSDTIKDLIVDAIGALATASIGYVSLKFNKGWVERFEVKRATVKKEK